MVGLMKVFSVLCLLFVVVLAKPRVKRVVGGEAYQPGEYPFSVSLWYLGDNNMYTANTSDRLHTCGGALIHPHWVLTSAACFDDDFVEGAGDMAEWDVVLGMHNQLYAIEEAQMLTASKVIFSPDYNLTDSYGDLALLKLNEEADLSNPRIGLIDFNDDPACPIDKQQCTVIGWGQTQEEPYGNGSYIPHAVNVKIQNLEDCKATYQRPNVMMYIGYIKFDVGTICAGVKAGGKDACFGDSGSPLLCTCGERVKVAATVSSGYGCARPGFSGIYANVGHYANWILETINKDA